MRFRDRREAGRHLAEVLRRADLGGGDAVVLGLPRGGVPVAFEVARALDAPLDVIVVRKLGVPFQPELAMGAIGEGGVLVVNQEVWQSSALEAVDIEIVASRERAELDRRARAVPGRPPPSRPRGAVCPHRRRRDRHRFDHASRLPSGAGARCRARRRRGARRLATGGGGAARRLRRDLVCRGARALLRGGRVVPRLLADIGRRGGRAPPEQLRRTARPGQRTCRVKTLHCGTRKPWSPPVRSRWPGVSPSPSHLSARLSSHTAAAAAAIARGTAMWRGSSTRPAWPRCSSTS